MVGKRQRKRTIHHRQSTIYGSLPHISSHSTRSTIRTPHSTFVIPSRLHPPSSPLGRWLRRGAADDWQAEGRYLVVLTLLITALVLAHLLLWNLLAPSWPPILGAAAATLLVLLPATMGRQPRVTVTCRRDRLHVRQGPRALELPLDEVTGHEQIDALRYHRHERRYAGTRAFVNRIPARVLLLHTDAGPVALGLAPSDQQRLLTCLDAARRDAAERAVGAL